MTQFLAIRTEIFGMNQQDFAALVGTSQGTVSRWEKPVNNPMKLFPDYRDLERIRKAARRRRLQWRDEWFFGEGMPKRQADVEAKGNSRIRRRKPKR